MALRKKLQVGKMEDFGIYKAGFMRAIAKAV